MREFPKKGDKLIFKGGPNGPRFSNYPNKEYFDLLKLGEEYIIEEIEVYNSWTSVKVEGVDAKFHLSWFFEYDKITREYISPKDFKHAPHSWHVYERARQKKFNIKTGEKLIFTMNQNPKKDTLIPIGMFEEEK